jgi:hypothetical protein
MIQKTVIKRKIIRERIPGRVLGLPSEAIVISQSDSSTMTLERPRPVEVNDNSGQK